VLCDGGEVQAAGPVLPRGVACPRTDAASTVPTSQIVTTSKGSLQVSEFPLASQPRLADTVLLVHDASFVDRRQSTARDYLLAFVAVGAVVLSLILISAAWWTFHRWFSRLLREVRGLPFRDDTLSEALSLPFLTQMREVMKEVEDLQRQEI